MADPDFGVFAFGPQADGQGDTVSFDYFWLDGQDPPGECECVPTGGDEFDSGALDTEKWNAIVRPQDGPDLVQRTAGWRSTTVNGDIYTNGNPAPTRNFILQNPTEAGQDWVIETHDRRAHAQRRLRAGRPAGLRRRRQLRQVRHPLRRRATPTLNRIELRSEVAGAIQVNPQPQSAGAGRHDRASGCA